MGELLDLKKNDDPIPKAKGERTNTAKSGRRNIYIKDDIFKRLKIYATINETSASAIIQSLVEQFLKEKREL